MPPIVSVVIATYNRSGPLRHAIQSVCDSTLTDWEVIVVGDACTDDTEACVSSFGDARIRFVNLPTRCGDQSGPANRGVELAQGQFIAFLNHDDLYLPNHLAGCVEDLEATGADLVWVPCVSAIPRQVAADDRPCQFVLSGAPAEARYSPYGFYVASSWMFRRSLADRIGPWTAPARTFVSPSQAWLFRAARSGATLRFRPHVTVVVVPALAWPRAYAARDCPEHDWLAAWLRRDPHAVSTMLEEAAVNEGGRLMVDKYGAPARATWRLLSRPVHALLLTLGVHPHSLEAAIRYGRSGGAVRSHARRTGA